MKVFEKISPCALQEAVETASQKIEEAMEVLEPFLLLLSRSERASLPRPKEGFPEAAHSLNRVIEENPELAAKVGLDPKGVENDLENVALLVPLAEKLANIWQQVSDSRLAWLSDAYLTCLAAYAVARVSTQDDPSLYPVINSFQKVFSSSRFYEKNHDDSGEKKKAVF